MPRADSAGTKEQRAEWQRRWNNSERGRAYKRRWDRENYWRVYQKPCPRCGGPMFKDSERCRDCCRGSRGGEWSL